MSNSLKAVQRLKVSCCHQQAQPAVLLGAEASANGESKERIVESGSNRLQKILDDMCCVTLACMHVRVGYAGAALFGVILLLELDLYWIDIRAS